MSTDITIGRTSAARKHDQLYDFSYRMFCHKYQVSSSTPLARQSSIPLARIPTTQSISTQDPADSALDPIDELRKLIDEGHSDLFEVSCIIYARQKIHFYRIACFIYVELMRNEWKSGEDF